MNGWAADLISQEVADTVGKVWGLGSDTAKDPGPWEGEQRNMWKPTQQEALWFHGGNLHQSRHYSLYLGLQLKARYEEHPDPRLPPPGGTPPEVTSADAGGRRGPRRPVLAGAVANLAAGALFGWSLVAQPVSDALGMSRGTAAAVFASAIVVFAVVLLVLRTSSDGTGRAACCGSLPPSAEAGCCWRRRRSNRSSCCSASVCSSEVPTGWPTASPWGSPPVRLRRCAEPPPVSS